MNRIFEIWCGEQRSGKTYQLADRIAALRVRPSIRCVLVFDRLGEYASSVEHGDEPYTAHDKFIADVAERGVPAVAVLQYGTEATPYWPAFSWAIREGDCVCVLDEAREFCPPGSSWRGAPHLREIVFAGRHLRNAAGSMCVAGLIVATQYPRSVHHDVHEQAETVMVSRLRGENGRAWVLGNFGAPELERVDALDFQRWACLRGRDPRRG